MPTETRPLPIDPFVAAIVDHVRRSRAAVVTAEPGAGKTTRVPPALLDDGPLILLQPRRVAARAIARRIAEERGWTTGREVGWQIRFERRFGPGTRLLVVTEGVLTARLQQDPLLSSFRTIVLDEFHERSVHADLAIALAKQAWRARSDLRLVVMSATLDASVVASYLDGCPIVAVPGQLYPIDVAYEPGRTVAEAAAGLLSATPGDVLCFLPGAGEIARTIDDLRRRPPVDADILPLHGSLDAAAQDAVLRNPDETGRQPAARRRIIVSTNIAETSLTVPGVTAVVDSGLHKVARYDPDRAIDSLEVERITLDSAAQRAGRAGRIGPGTVRRLWDARDRLRPSREAEIHRVDLSSAILDVLAWGGDPLRLDWFERPTDAALEAATALLERLGAISHGKLTSLGVAIHRIPLHPRLARMLVAGRGARNVARACALLSERRFLPPRSASTASDLLSATDDWQAVLPHIREVAREIETIARSAIGDRHGPAGDLTDDDFRRALLTGYPDRVAVRREAGSLRVLLASGRGAMIASESGVRDGDLLVAHDLVASDTEARIRVATRIEREWLQPTRREVEHRLDRSSGRVRAFSVERYGAINLGERPVSSDPEVAGRLLAAAWLERGPTEADRAILRRVRFAGRDLDVQSAIEQAARHARSLDDLQLARVLPADLLRAVDRDAPERLVLPTGRSVPIEYGEDGSVSAAVKLQELFGLADTPRIGPRREPVLLSLLAPNGRPVQRTRDLRSFWDRTYADVRRELRGRYPKHRWPEDPWTAPPGARPKPGRR